ncbi:MAG: protein kinase, partial [Ruthenibacterium sp.]
MDKFIGKRLDGRYLIQTLLGSGGMAVVYKAVDLKENKVVAVKILREECMNNEDLVRRFKNESKAISVLNHPNLVKVYDVSVSDKLQFIVMEYIDGITLKDYMEFRKQPLTYKETLHFVSQTLLALQHAHAKGIVHRDIKPQNIMLLSNGNIKVMDFGIARFARNESQTMTDTAIGSVHYISPEQAKGDVTDLKADIYSVGVMMYEMLAGRLPFDGESPVGVAIKQISDTPTPLRQINPAVPEALQAITERAMAK